VGTFFRELFRVEIYKRTQGRITRQVTFAGLALAIAMGIWRLSTILQLDPVIQAKPAMVTCTASEGSVAAAGKLVVSAAGPAATIDVRKGESLADVASAISGQEKTTGVAASVRDDAKEKTLVISSVVIGAAGVLKVSASPPGLLQIAGLDAAGVARGQDSLNLGLRYLIPLVLLLAALWGCYRVVNVPGFADFLIAVEAEMNKVSWPTRFELFRASLVVLLLIFSLAIILFAFDSFWGLFFRWTGVL
jgi:preprotein translocase SecE subunit